MAVILNSIVLLAIAIFVKVLIFNGSNFNEPRLASKTPYRFVANTSNHVITFPGCSPIKILMIIRHGTRNPDKSCIHKINEFLPEIRDQIVQRYFHSYDISLDSNEVMSLQNWTSIFHPDEEKFLVNEGRTEMYEIASRMKQRFPELFKNEYNPHAYKFRFTDTQRTKDSAKHFAKGLFDEEALSTIQFPVPLKLDPILRFYKLCNKWKEKIKKNIEAFKEVILFEQSAEMSKLIKTISYDLKMPLSLENITLIYKACAFETAINRYILSPWCPLINPDLMKALEYAEDLKYYWIDGYGYKLTYSQACALMQNIIYTLTESNETGIFYFTHSGTLLKLIAYLGLYKETPLRHNDFGKNDYRHWKVSKIDTFGTNMAFILFNCTNEKKLLMMHQEHLINFTSNDGNFSNFDNNYLYDLEKFLKRYSTECNFNEMCTIKNS